MCGPWAQRRHVGAAQAQAQLPHSRPDSVKQTVLAVSGGSPPPGSFKPRISLPRPTGTGKASQVCGPGLAPSPTASRPASSPGLSLAGWVTEDRSARLHNARNGRPARPEAGARPGLLPHVI